MDQLTLTLIVEAMRDYLVKLAEEKGSLTDAEVVAFSQTLDTYIVELSKLNLNYTSKA